MFKNIFFIRTKKNYSVSYWFLIVDHIYFSICVIWTMYNAQGSSFLYQSLRIFILIQQRTFLKIVSNLLKLKTTLICVGHIFFNLCHLLAEIIHFPFSTVDHTFLYHPNLRSYYDNLFTVCTMYTVELIAVQFFYFHMYFTHFTVINY